MKYKNFNYIMFMLFMVIFMIYKFGNFFLMLMISMEFLVLLNLLVFLMYQSLCMNDWLFLYYLIFAVSESVIGLSLMICLIYNYGDQNLSILNLNW